MAILSKIREKTVLLIVIIAFALFAFLLSDFIKSQRSGSPSNIGDVNGKNIDYKEFITKVNNVTKQQPNTSNTAAMNGIWDQEVRSILLEEHCNNLGLAFGKEQILGTIKTDPSIAQNPNFLNAAGKFDEGKFTEFVKARLSDPNIEARTEWLNYEKQVLQSSKEQVYNTLLKASVYTTKAEAKLKYERENNKADFDYVAVAFSTVNDDQVKVTNEEIVEFMKKSPKKYKSDNTRTLDYIFVENKPSTEDEISMKNKINTYLNGGILTNENTGRADTIARFASATNLKSYVNKYSEVKFDSTFTQKKDLPLEHQEKIFNLAPGQVYGPYTDAGAAKLTRIAARKNGSSAKASHILISYKGAQSAASTVKLTKEEALAKANGLLAQVNANPAQFPMLAMTNTDDTGSKQNGGVYDNITPNQMMKPFNDFVFNKPVGATGVVETDYGYHVMRNEAKYDGVLLANVVLKVKPSEKTENANAATAMKIESEAMNSNLEKAAKKLKLVVNPSVSVKAIDENVGSMGSQTQIVNWAFNEDTDLNAVKKFDLTGGYAIVSLKAKTENGLLPLDQAKQMVEPLIKNEKKALIIRKKMSGKTLEAVSKATGSSIQTATGLSLASPMIASLGYEPKVVGAAFRLTNGKVSDVIDGNMGVYMIKGKTVVKAPAITDYKTQIEQANQQSKNSAAYTILQSLKEKADITDNRGKF